VVTGERFWSDYDQRHSLSTYALYRLSNRTSLGAKFRYGTNYPITGYVGQQSFSPNAPPLFGGEQPLFFGLTDRRNTLRLPVYARLDVHADRAVSWSGRRVAVRGSRRRAEPPQRAERAVFDRPQWTTE
jgi:hypothetical protein